MIQEAQKLCFFDGLHVSAETTHRSFEEIDLEEDGRSTVRISILIGIGKFAA